MTFSYLIAFIYTQTDQIHPSSQTHIITQFLFFLPFSNTIWNLFLSCQWLWQLRWVPDETVSTTCVKQAGQDILWESSCKQLLELLMSSILLTCHKRWQPASAFTVKTLTELEIHQEMIILSRTCPLMLLGSLGEVQNFRWIWIHTKHTSGMLEGLAARTQYIAVQRAAPTNQDGLLVSCSHISWILTFFTGEPEWQSLPRWRRKRSREVVWGKRNEN